MFHEKHMTTGAWLIFMLLMAIPIVNIVLIIIILLDRTYNRSLRNFIKAQLVFVILGIVLLFGLWSVIMGFLEQIADNDPSGTLSIIQVL